MVKRRRLELPRHNCHYPLKVARLPIPPPLQHFKYKSEFPCPRQDSNLHVVKHTHLKRARLPIPPLGLKRVASCFGQFRMLSGKRDSNPRPRPWQGRALPTELFPHCNLIVRCISLNAVAKVQLFSKPANFSHIFFQKKLHLVDFFYKTSLIHPIFIVFIGIFSQNL